MKPIYARLFLAFALFWIAVTPSAEASGKKAELIMFEHDGCPWCIAWHRDVGRVYAKTWEGKAAPLRRVDILQPLPDDLDNLVVERASPIFVVMVNGEERGRIRGYPGDDFFWGLLGKILNDAGISAPSSN